MVNGFQKPMDLRVWVLHIQTHANKPVRSSFCPINKPTGNKVDLYPYPNREKSIGFRVSDTHCHL